jgi:hypothetical protein
MKLVINLIDRESSRSITQTIGLEGKSFDQIKSEFETLVADSGFRKYYTDNEVDGVLDDEVQTILERLGLMPD